MLGAAFAETGEIMTAQNLKRRVVLISGVPVGTHKPLSLRN